MVSRRKALLTGGGLLSSSFAGCLDVLGTDASVREVSVLLDNRGDTPQTFTFALELEAERLDRDSRTVEAKDNKVITIDPPDDSFPVAFYGSVGDVESTLEFDDLNDLEEDFCLYLYFWYQHPFRGDVTLERAPYVDC